jgi:hypothetical protein
MLQRVWKAVLAVSDEAGFTASFLPQRERIEDELRNSCV